MANSAIAIAITGASGAVYALRLIECLLRARQQVYLMISSPAKVVLATEMDLHLPGTNREIAEYLAQRFSADPTLLTVFGKNEWMAPVASGSNAPRAMVICPCSTGTLSAIANGSSRSLIERAADVMLKEQRKLIIVPREMPYSAIHLENMLTLSRLGVTVMPASPAFYHRPTTIAELIDHVVARILDHLNVPQDLIKPWGSNGKL
ncbi:MAG: UbiX family flavin prenyltransferase [Gammaproteobacteria bacterium]|nr:UbiX family flavin prenyltransferase [Gammaproteobacteria bacterium]